MDAERPYLIGLTGSIGMGKSETANMFAELGIPVFNADAAVHRLYEKGGEAVSEIAKVFPDCIRVEGVDRTALAAAVNEVPDGYKILEAIVHPLVAREQQHFIDRATLAGAEMVVLDIPLLYETGGHVPLDATIVVSAPHDVQRRRVLAREGMTDAKLDHILARQMPDIEKRGKADFVIETGEGFAQTREQVRKIVDSLHRRHLTVGKKDGNA